MFQDPQFKGCLAYGRSEYLYQRKVSTSTKSLICAQIYMTIPTVILTTMNFYLLEEMNDKIEILKAAGLIDYWHRKGFDENSLHFEESKHPKVIKVRHVLGAIQVWIVGLTYSLLVFLIELMSNSTFVRFVKSYFCN